MYTKIQPWCASDEWQIRDSVLPLGRERARVCEKKRECVCVCVCEEVTETEWRRRKDLLIEYNENGSMNDLSEWVLINEATDAQSDRQKIVQIQDLVAVYCRYCCFPFYVLNENWFDRLVRVGARQWVILKLVDSLHQHQSNRIVFDWWHIEIVQILFKSCQKPKIARYLLMDNGEWKTWFQISKNVAKQWQTNGFLVDWPCLANDFYGIDSSQLPIAIIYYIIKFGTDKGREIDRERVCECAIPYRIIETECLYLYVVTIRFHFEHW